MKKLIITIFFYLYSDTGPHILQAPLRPLFLLTFAKESQFLSFYNFLDFLGDFFKSHRYALCILATLRIARFVAVWRRAATPTATTIFIHDMHYCYKCHATHWEPEDLHKLLSERRVEKLCWKQAIDLE